MKRRGIRWARPRALRATVAALVWLGGLYVLPFLHNLDHRSDHTHAAPAHSHPHVHESTPPDGHRREPLDPHHGEGSVLHFAAVVVGTELVVLPEPATTLIRVATAPLSSVEAPALLAFLARGPPAPPVH